MIVNYIGVNIEWRYGFQLLFSILEDIHGLGWINFKDESLGADALNMSALKPNSSFKPDSKEIISGLETLISMQSFLKPNCKVFD